MPLVSMLNIVPYKDSFYEDMHRYQLLKCKTCRYPVIHVGRLPDIEGNLYWTHVLPEWDIECQLIAKLNEGI